MRRILLLVLVTAVLLPSGGAVAAEPVVVVDDAGDAGDAPDVVRVEAARAPGQVVFRIRFDGSPSLEPGAQLVTVLLDADRDETTGPEGTELAVRADAGGARLEAWEDALWQEVPGAEVRSSYAGGLLTIALGRAALRGSRAFEFVVVASEGDLDLEGTADYAPEVEPAAFALPGIVRVLANVGPAHAGKRLTATPSVTLTDGSRERPTTIVCTARLRGKLLARAGPCAWRVPVGAKGATIVVTVTATWEGAAARLATQRVRVR